MTSNVVSFKDYLSKKNVMQAAASEVLANAACVLVQQRLRNMGGFSHTQVYFEKNHMFVVLNVGWWKWHVEWMDNRVQQSTERYIQAVLIEAGTEMEIHLYRKVSVGNLRKECLKLGLLR